MGCDQSLDASLATSKPSCKLLFCPAHPQNPPLRQSIFPPKGLSKSRVGPLDGFLKPDFGRPPEGFGQVIPKYLVDVAKASLPPHRLPGDSSFSFLMRKQRQPGFGCGWLSSLFERKPACFGCVCQLSFRKQPFLQYGLS